MRILMDRPGDFAPLGPAAAAPAEPDGDEQALWARLTGGAAAVAVGGRTEAARPLWRAGYLVAEAPASQYDVLRSLAAADALPAGSVFCLAGSGRGFHGQHGRSWCTLSGNLHLSAALAADLPAAACGPALPALAAVAALDVVRRFAAPDRRTGIKWVNDLWVDGAKVGGVLTAVRTRLGRIERVFLGVGLNVGARPGSAGDAFAPAATCLDDAAGGAPPGLGAVALALLDAIQERFAVLAARGPADLLGAYRAGSLVLGRRVTVHPDEASAAGAAAPRTGTVAAIGDDLSLHLAEGGAPVAGGRLELAPD